MQVELLSTKKLKSYLKTKYKKSQGKIVALWEYQDRDNYISFPENSQLPVLSPFGRGMICS